MLTEVNFDAMVGPTHHFGGLGVGNVASQMHARQASAPRQAALQGIAKARLLDRLGVPQFLLLPPARPRTEMLSELGFCGSLADQLWAAHADAPEVLSAVFSSAFMWAANSATVTPAHDARDGRLHITPANLISSLHRGAEAAERTADFNVLFTAIEGHCIHPPLPALVPLRDEGAANHMRLCDEDGEQGVHVLVYGDPHSEETAGGLRFLPRQTRAACEALCRRHRLEPSRAVLLQQQAKAISAGVFHNDVIATSHQNLLLFHENAFSEATQELERIERIFDERSRTRLLRVMVSEEELPLEDAVASYFFNSQIVSPNIAPDGGAPPKMALVCPTQCQQVVTAQRLIERLIADSDLPIEAVYFVDLTESMANGGGPACVRLRVPLEPEQVELLPQHLRMNERLEECLIGAVERWYPERLELSDFCNSDLIEYLSIIPEELTRTISGGG